VKRHFHSLNRSKARLAAFAATVALGVLIAGAVTVVSRQNERAAKVHNQKSNASFQSAVSVRAISQDRTVAQTTPIQELTPEEARVLTEAVRPMVNKSTEGLIETKDADEGVTVDLRDRFQNVTVARRNADGSISYSCVDTPESASAFFQPGRTSSQFNGSTRPTPVRH
jgi:hypothetical protein